MFALAFGLWSLDLPVFKDQRPKPKDHYSYFSASNGSTFAALRAGKYEATSAVNPRTTAVLMKVAGSVGVTPNSNFESKLVNVSDAVTPKVTPMITRINACLITIRST